MPTSKSLLCTLLHGGVIEDRNAPEDSEERTLFKVKGVSDGQIVMHGGKESAEVLIRPKYFDRDPVLAEVANCWHHGGDRGLFRTGKQGLYEYGVLRRFYFH